MTVVAIDIDESLAVTMTEGASKPCAYTIVYKGEEVTQYETSADPRTIGGRIGLRNVICKRVPDYEKAAIDEALSEEIPKHTERLTEALGPQ